MTILFSHLEINLERKIKVLILYSQDSLYAICNYRVVLSCHSGIGECNILSTMAISLELSKFLNYVSACMVLVHFDIEP